MRFREGVCLETAVGFYAVGQFFLDFSEVAGEMVVTALSRPVHAQRCHAPAGARV